MTIAVDMGRKATKTTTTIIKFVFSEKNILENLYKESPVGNNRPFNTIKKQEGSVNVRIQKVLPEGFPILTTFFLFV